MRILIISALLASAAFAQTAINDMLYLQGSTPWTGQIVVSWPAFTNCAGVQIAKGSRVSPVNAGAVAISLWATDCASPSFAYSVTYKTMGGANNGLSWSETWAIPSSPSIVTLGAVRQSSTLKFFPSQIIAAGLNDGTYCINVASEAATGLVACSGGGGGSSAWADITGKPSTFAPSAHASTHASGGGDPVTLAESQVTGLVSDLASKAASNASTTVNGQTCALGSSCTISTGGGGTWGSITGTLSAQTDLQSALDAKAAASALTSHTGNTSNPHSVTAAQVGLGNVDNTADSAKPVSTATQTALNLKAPLANPAFTGAVKTDTEYDNGTCTTAATIAPTNGNRQKITLTNAQTCAITFTQPTTGTVSIRLRVIQSSLGGWDGLISTSGVKWPAAVVPPITPTSGAVDLIVCDLDGTATWCIAAQDLR